MLDNLKKYEKVLAVIGGLSFVTLIALWLLARFSKNGLNVVKEVSSSGLDIKDEKDEED